MLLQPHLSAFSAQGQARGPQKQQPYLSGSLTDRTESCRCPQVTCRTVSPKSTSSTATGLSPVSTSLQPQHLAPVQQPQQQSGLFMRYAGEHSFNLAEYMIMLDKPIGLTLAMDPAVGQIIVQGIKEGSPAAQCGMIQVGDVVKMCSAVFGEDMWQALDIRRVRWAINNRTSKVKMVLERARRPQTAATWYSKGQVGCATHERDVLQLPVSFNTSSSQDDWPQDIASPGRPLMVAFHTSLPPSPLHRMGAAAAARTARLQALREELAEARREPEMELGPPPIGAARTSAGASSSNSNSASSQSSTSSSKVGGGSTASPSTAGGSSSLSSWASSNNSSSSSSSNGTNSAGSTAVASGPLGRLMESLAGGMAGSASSNGTGAGSSANGATSSQAEKTVRRPKDKKVVPVLPWLLVSSGRLDTRDLTQIASHRGLCAVLELGLCRSNGVLAIRGSSEATLSAYPMPASVAVSGSSGGSSFITGSPAGNGAPHSPLSIMSQALTPRSRGPAGSGGAAVGTAQEAGSSGAQQPVVTELRVRALIHAAAALQRLAVRRSCGTVHHATPETCNVLLHCAEPGLEADVACVLAAWLHWYAHMPLQEALLSAEIALGCTIEAQGVVESATEALVAAAEERLNEVVLTWRYGGLSASVAGDVVGSWSTRMPLIRCKNPLGCKGAVARGNFYLELTGLRPGVYYYKYIVDGTWAVDPAAPKVLDASGNWNNVLEVHQRPPVTSSRERLALARWHARHLAWETKMGLRPVH